MVHETLYLCYVNMISSWNIALQEHPFRGVLNNGAPS